MWGIAWWGMGGADLLVRGGERGGIQLMSGEGWVVRGGVCSMYYGWCGWCDHPCPYPPHNNYYSRLRGRERL